MDYRRIFHVMATVNYYIAAVLLIVAGVFKMADPYPGEIMGGLLERYIITATGYRLITLLQPWFEIGIGLFAFIGWRAEYTAKALGLIYLFFGGLILYVSEGHLTLPLGCGCFGAGETPVYLLLLRNALIALFLFFFRGHHQHWTLSNLIQPAVR